MLSTPSGHPPSACVTSGAYLDGADVLAMSIIERARETVFLACSYPVEVPGRCRELPALGGNRRASRQAAALGQGSRPR